MSSLKSQVRRAIASLTSTPGFGVDPPTVSAAVAMTERYSLSSLLPYKGYDTENDLVVLDCVDELSMGFGFELAPAIIAGTSMEEQLEAVITKLPDDTVMQIGIFFNDDVGHDLADWETKRVANCKFEVLSEMTRRRAAFMRECAQERSLLPAQLLHVRMARLLVFVRIPFKGDNDSPIELDRWIGSVRQDAAKVGDAFSATGLPARRLDGREHRRIIAQMLNPQFTIEEMDNASSGYKGFPKGLVRKESRIRRRNEDGGIEFTGGSRDTVAVTVTVDSYPIDSYLPNTRQLLGDLFSRTDAIPERFWLWTVIHCPDKNKAREVQQFKLGNITRMTLSESAWFRTMARDLYRRREETQAVLDATEQRRTIVRSITGITLFCEPDNVGRAVENVTAVWRRAAGFEASVERAISMPMFMAAMPYCYNYKLDHGGSGLRRLELMTSFNAACMMPVAADWRGHELQVGGPLLLSRRGQIASLDFLRSETNYNVTVVAESGSGKSFFVNDLIADFLSRGGFVRMIDVGGSYQKLAEIIGGEVLSFDIKRPRSMNPFWGMVTEIDFKEKAASLREIIISMAFSRSDIPNWEFAIIDRGVQAAWEEYKDRLETHHVWRWFKDQKDSRLQDLADQLEIFAIGRYKAWFNGAPEVQFNNDFMILELNELNADKFLRAIVLNLVINLILDDMYRKEQREGANALLRPKLLGIDEAWDLMGKDSGRSGKFIEEAARRIRKQRGVLVTITQSYEDYQASDSAKAALANAAWRVSLRQSGDSIKSAQTHGALMGGGELIWKLLPTVARGTGYSEAHIMNNGIGEVFRLIVDPFSRLTYSTAPDDKNNIAAKRAQGKELIDALKELADSEDAADRGRRR